MIVLPSCATTHESDSTACAVRLRMQLRRDPCTVWQLTVAAWSVPRLWICISYLHALRMFSPSMASKYIHALCMQSHRLCKTTQAREEHFPGALCFRQSAFLADAFHRQTWLQQRAWWCRQSRALCARYLLSRRTSGLRCVLQHWQRWLHGAQYCLCSSCPCAQQFLSACQLIRVALFFIVTKLGALQ